MTQVVSPPADSRQKRLFVFAWAATLLPLIAFGILTAQLVELKRDVGSWQTRRSELTAEVEDKTRKLADLEQSLAAKRAELDAANETLTAKTHELSAAYQQLAVEQTSVQHYREFAGIKIQFYRDEDRARVESALGNKGFKIEVRRGSAPLIRGSANSIAFGSAVAQQDLIDIATALVEADLPLKQIAPARKVTEARLIQVYASANAEQSCGLLTVEQIRAGQTCGPR